MVQPKNPRFRCELENTNAIAAGLFMKVNVYFETFEEEEEAHDKLVVINEDMVK